MKKLLFALLTLLTACSSNDKPEQKNNDRDTSVVIRDTVAALSVPKALAPLAFIKQRVNYINRSSVSSKHIEFMCDEKTKVDYYYQNKVPVKIAIDFGWVGDAHAKEEYYFDEGKLIFYYEFVEGGPACEGCIKMNEYRSYINNDKVIQYLKNKEEAQCKRCEFGTLSKPYKLLMTSKPDEAKKVLCN